ncbi:MAG: phenylalanine--tRNA ligase subunit alpha [Candidatus Omnitrophica bacterium]|nr:phenylalanine--tRNA ligase subunit alpha [Candidatus Omnitrophota bacterium]
MENELKILEEEFLKDCQQACGAKDAEGLRVKYLGRKAQINQFFSKIPTLEPTQRGAYGRELNILKQKMSAIIEKKLNERQNLEESLDLTYPGIKPQRGSRHVLTTVTETICDIFQKQGFIVAQGGEIEDEWHNFTALNFPTDHPSRDAFDTFYLNLDQDKKNGRYLLRCHTSPSQIRVMCQNKPPMAVISPGRVYRPDEVDATHSFMFHQVEGFAISENINFAHLKGVLLDFAKGFFAKDARLRFRPHFFPFTEPSAEVDVSCFMCNGKKKETKCSVCKDKGWIEVLGCGMIHPNVLDTCNIDSQKYQGFAFGLGVERMAMLKYGITDIRLFYENDLRFLEQFNQL